MNMNKPVGPSASILFNKHRAAFTPCLELDRDRVILVHVTPDSPQCWGNHTVDTVHSGSMVNMRASAIET